MHPVSSISVRIPLVALLCQMIVGCVAVPLGSMNPLHIAAQRGDVKGVEAWISSGASLDSTYNDYTIVLGYTESSGSRVRNKTALMFAAENGRFDVAKLLIDAGADMYLVERDARGDERGSAFDLAVEQEHMNIAKYLWEKSDRARLGKKLAQHFSSACRKLCNEWQSIDPDKNLALYLAKIISSSEILGIGIGLTVCYSERPLENLRFLLRSGVPFPKNTLGCISGSEGTKNRYEVVTFLLAQGADPNYIPREPYRGSPLMGAAFIGDPELVDLLLTNGANPNLQNGWGGTALMFAAGTCYYGSNPSMVRNQLRIVERLVAAGADTRLRTKDGQTAVEREVTAGCCRPPAASEDQTKMCQLLSGTASTKQ